MEKVLITGGAGFIGGCLVRRLLKTTKAKIYNLDKFSYSSDLSFLESENINSKNHNFIKLDLLDYKKLESIIEEIKPDIIFHFAAESHVDRSIDGPKNFVDSNIIGTFNLLQATMKYWSGLNREKAENFKFHHISTDEVYGSLDMTGKFSEKTSYDPRSPYSATKAASDHLVKAWHHTYGLPILITNCSNNFGPWQFPEKLIPLVILKAISGEPIPIYGKGQNVRDWLFVEDHITAIILVARKGSVGNNYCIGGFGERTNIEVVKEICDLLDKIKPKSFPYETLINFVKDRPGHDLRYAINPSKVISELGWKPKYQFNQALKLTVLWYLNNIDWCKKVCKNTSYKGERLGNY